LIASRRRCSDRGDDLETVVLNRIYDFVLGLPRFKGKAKIESVFRAFLRPHVSTVNRDIRMELDAEEWPQVDLRALGRLEPRTTALFERILRPGDNYVDVGAHVGYHALLAARLVGARGRIFAVEPQPYNCAKLLTNAELNGFSNIVVIAAAVGEAEGFVSLQSQARHDRSRLTLAGPGVNDGALTFVVPKITLLWLVGAYGVQPVKLLKIDVEGFELEVLSGAGDALGTVAAFENIVFEVLPGEGEDRTRTIERLLRDRGYHMFDVEGAAWRPGQACVENNVWARRS
jgi:FkbM family methyltransferase